MSVRARVDEADAPSRAGKLTTFPVLTLRRTSLILSFVAVYLLTYAYPSMGQRSCLDAAGTSLSCRPAPTPRTPPGHLGAPAPSYYQVGSRCVIDRGPPAIEGVCTDQRDLPRATRPPPCRGTDPRWTCCSCVAYTPTPTPAPTPTPLPLEVLRRGPCDPAREACCARRHECDDCGGRRPGSPCLLHLCDPSLHTRGVCHFQSNPPGLLGNNCLCL